MVLTLAIGLQISGETPIAHSSPPVDILMTSLDMSRSRAISGPALSNDVLEKQAPSVVQLVTKTTTHFRHIVKASYISDAFVSTLSREFGGCEIPKSGVNGVPGGRVASRPFGIDNDIVFTDKRRE